MTLDTLELGDNPPWAAYFLPVIFIYLDPAHIPTPESLDALSTASDPPDRVAAARIALYTLSNLYQQVSVPQGAAPDLWPRVWGWVEFFHTYWRALPGIHPSEEINACRLHSSIVCLLRSHPGTHDRIVHTQGVRPILVKAWVTLIEDDMRAAIPGAMRETIQFISALTDDLELPHNFEAIVDGLGGNLPRLAAGIVKQISRALANTEWQLSVAGIASAVAFAQAMAADNDTWNTILVSQGMITSVVEALHELENHRVHNVDATIDVCLMLVARYMQVDTGVAEALRAGILRSIVSLGTQRKDAQASPITKFLKPILKRILPNSLISHAVLTAIRDPFKEISGQDVLEESPLFEAWENFTFLVQSRLLFLYRWDDSGALTFKACDNMLCGRIHRKSFFKRCSSCQFTAYCSPTCQTADWWAAHREECSDLRATRLANMRPLSTRERHFMRALLHDDYEACRPAVALQQLTFMREHPGIEFLTLFDYTLGESPDLQILPRNAVSPARDLAVELPALWARAARSRGQMAIHVMYVTDGGMLRPRVFPLRASSSAFHDGLRALVDMEPEEGEQWITMAQNGISALMRVTYGNDTLTEIH
ncbi:hypothetical protein C8R43DRAFT_1130428 [Mycena crocata]|nr:hypothetical protein C8R43DRAFT_1130428 [Mycena crocata]